MADMNDRYKDFPDEVHPFKNFTPRQNPPKPAESESDRDKLAPLDDEKLQSMSKEELIGVIRLCNAHHVAVALMTKQEQVEAMMHRLAVKALDPAGRETLAAINQWLDREKGRPITPIAAQIQVKENKPVDKKELARRIEFLMATAQDEHEGAQILLPAL